jgi:hypothetical protein
LGQTDSLTSRLKNGDDIEMKKVLLGIDDYSELIFLEALLKKVGLNIEGVQNQVAIPEKILNFNPDLVILTAYGTRVNGVKLLSRIKKKNGYPKVIILFHRSAPVAEKEIRNFPMDVLLESPVNPKTMLEMTERLLEMEEGALMKKFDKLDLGQSLPLVGEDKNNRWKLKERSETGGPPSSPLDELFSLDGNAKPASSDGLSSESGHAYKEDQVGTQAGHAFSQQLEKHRVGQDSTAARRSRYEKASKESVLPPFQPMLRTLVEQEEKDFRKAEKDPEIVSIDEERRQYVSKMFLKK